MEIRTSARRIHPRHQPRRQNHPPQPPAPTTPAQRITPPRRITSESTANPESRPTPGLTRPGPEPDTATEPATAEHHTGRGHQHAQRTPSALPPAPGSG